MVAVEHQVFDATDRQVRHAVPIHVDQQMQAVRALRHRRRRCEHRGRKIDLQGIDAGAADEDVDPLVAAVRAGIVGDRAAGRGEGQDITRRVLEAAEVVAREGGRGVAREGDQVDKVVGRLGPVAIDLQYGSRGSINQTKVAVRKRIIAGGVVDQPGGEVGAEIQLVGAISRCEIPDEDTLQRGRGGRDVVEGQDVVSGPKRDIVEAGLGV